MATVILGGATAFVATIMGLDVLVEMMSIGEYFAQLLPRQSKFLFKRSNASALRCVSIWLI